MRLLIVEDDLAIAEPLLAGLRHHGFDGTHVICGADALASSTNDTFDVVLLDLGLPDMDGLDVCREIRKHSSVPIIMVTARGEEIDRIVGLELGADDYVSKPFGIRELIARIRAVRRRFDSASEALHAVAPTNEQGEGGASSSGHDRIFPATDDLAVRRQTNAVASLSFSEHQANAAEVLLPNLTAKASAPVALILGALTVDHRTHRVHVGDMEIALTPKEFGLLVVLGADPGAVVPRMSIIEQVWDEHWYGPTKTLDVHVAQLRQKLGNPGWIETVRGVGYRLADPAQSVTDPIAPTT
jgi:DNA-binding response OmpR family regulator